MVGLLRHFSVYYLLLNEGFEAHDGGNYWEDNKIGNIEKCMSIDSIYDVHYCMTYIVYRIGLWYSFTWDFILGWHFLVYLSRNLFYEVMKATSFRATKDSSTFWYCCGWFVCVSPGRVGGGVIVIVSLLYHTFFFPCSGTIIIQNSLCFFLFYAGGN